MILFPKEKVSYSTWYFFPLLLFPIHQKKQSQTVFQFSFLELKLLVKLNQIKFYFKNKSKYLCAINDSIVKKTLHEKNR